MLAAGAGERLRPLTRLRPKVLCPVGGATLLDHNLDRVAAIVGSGPAHVAVNAHHLAPQVEAHAAGRAHVSVEEGEALGTAGGVAHLRGWLDGRPALVVNGDTWSTVDLEPLVRDWDGTTVRVLLANATELRARGVGVLGSLLPAGVAATLPDAPAGLFEVCWGPLQATGRLETAGGSGRFVACDRPRDYLAANLAVSGGASVIGAGAAVEGEVERCVVWPGAVVEAGERLVDAVRASAEVTVLVR